MGSSVAKWGHIRVTNCVLFMYFMLNTRILHFKGISADMRDPLEAPKNMHEYMREIITISNYESANILCGVKRIDPLKLEASKPGPMRASAPLFLLPFSHFLFHFRTSMLIFFPTTFWLYMPKHSEIFGPELEFGL